MKLKKILAAVAAAAVAVSTMAVNAFAVDKGTYVADDGSNTFFYLVADDGKPQYAVDNNVDVTTIYGVTWHATFAEAEVADEATWIGGGIGANSNSTGWKQIEWGRNDKEVVADLENGTITWKSADPIFKADDAYVQLWVTTWGGTVTFNSADLLDKDGNVIEGTPVAETEEAAPEETEAEAPEAEEATEDEDAEEAADVEADEAEEEEAAPAVTEAPVAEVAPAVENTPAPATVNTAVASVVAVMAVAGAAAIAAKKRK